MPQSLYDALNRLAAAIHQRQVSDVLNRHKTPPQPLPWHLRDK